MARCRFTTTVMDSAGNVIQNAHVDVFFAGTTTPVTDLYNFETGGSPITSLTSGTKGDVTGWLNSPKRIDLRVGDNAGGAYYPSSPGSPFNFADFTKTIDAWLPPVDQAVDTIVAVTAAGTFNIDLNAGRVFNVTLNANSTLGTISNIPAERAATIEFYLVQGTGGNRTMTWPASFKWPGGTVPVLSVAVGKIDRVVAETINGGTSWNASLVGADFR